MHEIDGGPKKKLFEAPLPFISNAKSEKKPLLKFRSFDQFHACCKDVVYKGRAFLRRTLTRAFQSRLGSFQSFSTTTSFEIKTFSRSEREMKLSSNKVCFFCAAQAMTPKVLERKVDSAE